MARLSDLSDAEHKFLSEYELPHIHSDAFVAGPPLAQRRVAMVTTAGLRRRADQSYAVDAVDYRVLPTNSRDDLIMDHVSAGYDRTGFMQDLNVVLPLDRLAEMAADGEIGSVAEYHYSFMGAGDTLQMEPAARQVAELLRRDAVDAVLLSPV